MQLNPYLGDYGDDAEFLILGQGLARGDGYAWINSPEHPAHNRYPPGYPVYLSAVMLITGTQASAIDAVVPAKIATALTLLLALPPLWLLARRRLPVAWAAAAVALFALNPFALRFAAQVMSDVPYLPVGFAALALADWLADRETRKADRPRPGRIHRAWRPACRGGVRAQRRDGGRGRRHAVDPMGSPRPALARSASPPAGPDGVRRTHAAVVAP
jgi:hypothetical protein